jgi:hypothetical protein
MDAEKGKWQKDIDDTAVAHTAAQVNHVATFFMRMSHVKSVYRVESSTTRVGLLKAGLKYPGYSASWT